MHDLNKKFVYTATKPVRSLTTLRVVINYFFILLKNKKTCTDFEILKMIPMYDYKSSSIFRANFGIKKLYNGNLSSFNSQQTY